MRNLLQNAFKFTPENGKIRIALNKKNKQFTIEVEDNGVGMEKDKLDQILGSSNDDFNISNGLGLQLFKEFTSKANGSLQIESKVGKGSTFKVTIPIQEKSEFLKVKFAENKL